MADISVDTTTPLRFVIPEDYYSVANGEVTLALTSFAGGAGDFTTLDASGAVTFLDTLDVGGATTLAATNITSANVGTATINTTLTLTGAAVVGLEDSFTVCGVSIFGNTAPVYVASPFAGAVVKVQSVVNGEALTTGGETVVIGLGVPGTPMTDGTITIATLAAIGDLDVCNPSALNTVAVGSVLSIDPAGTNASEGSTVNLTFTIRRSA